MVAACWSPATPRIGIAAPSMSRLGHAEIVGIVLDLRQHGARHVEQREQLVVPVAGLDVVEQRAAGIGGVGGVQLAAGQPPDQVGVDRAEGEFAALGPLARARHVVEDPVDLGAPRNRGRAAARSCARPASHCRPASAARRCLRGAPVLPDDGVVDRLAGRPVPDDRRLALVGDADGGDVAWPRSRPSSAPSCTTTGRSPRSPRGHARPSPTPESAG